MPIKGMSPKETMHKEMHEFKHGELHSGSKKGPVVKSRKQAIAIGLSEERKAMGHKEHKGHNPVHDGYGFGNQHNEKTEFGQAIAGGKGGKHAHDRLEQSIAGGKNPQGEKRGETESGLRSHDNPRSDDRQPHGRKTGERENVGVAERREEGSRGMEHHIAGGEHGHHEHGSGKAEHHPSIDHREPHRFSGSRVEGAHGFGHGVNRREGHLRMSGMAGAHRIGKR